MKDVSSLGMRRILRSENCETIYQDALERFRLYIEEDAHRFAKSVLAATKHRGAKRTTLADVEFARNNGRST